MRFPHFSAKRRPHWLKYKVITMANKKTDVDYSVKHEDSTLEEKSSTKKDLIIVAGGTIFCSILFSVIGNASQDVRVYFAIGLWLGSIICGFMGLIKLVHWIRDRKNNEWSTPGALILMSILLFYTPVFVDATMKIK